MALAAAHQDQAQFAEDIRLVIWDLDDTFWSGTLTEGGYDYVPAHDRLVRDLAARGIMSSICSKNDHDQVEAELRARGIWDHFIFPSIDWTPKGPRINALLDQIGLRAASALFLDDNPMNLAQAAHMTPGLNIGGPALIAELGNLPQLQGRPDPQLRRLAQYKVKERKADAARALGGDTLSFLRGSDVRVMIDYDVEANIDRAIELINRTNQLNFTKDRLPEDPEAARADLTALLSRNTTDAALLRVRDAFGDYGYVGFYLTERLNNRRRLRHFCFSCRALNMYVEHWTYAHLDRPDLSVVGAVLSDPTSQGIVVDWITAVSEMDGPARPLDQGQRYERIFARGGCDLASLMHYFRPHTDTVVEEFNGPRDGQMIRRDHSSFLIPVLQGGLAPDQQIAAAALGYEPQDFETALTKDVGEGALFLLSFWADADIPLYRHRHSGLRLPLWLVGAQHHDLLARDDLREKLANSPLLRTRLDTLAREYDHDGLLTQSEMRTRYRIILDAVPDDAACAIILANTRGPRHFADPDLPPHPHHCKLNTALREVSEGRRNVILIDPEEHIQSAEDLHDLNHFARPVYHRMYLEILSRLPRMPFAGGRT